MEGSKWEQARVYWGKVLADDPSDEEALKGAEVSEFNLTSELSVKIRDNRMSGNIYGALEAGIKLYRLHIKWGRTKTDVDMARFRRKEFMALYPHYLKVLKRSIKLNRPLKGSFDLENFKHLFTSLGKGELVGIQGKLNKLGKKECYRFKTRGKQYPYWRNYIKKHCEYYGVNISKDHRGSARIGVDLIGKIEKMASYGGSHARKFPKAFVEAFRSSLWFNPRGAKKTMYKYNGNFSNFTDAETGKKYKKYTQDGAEKTYEYTVIWKIQKLSLDSESSFSINGQQYYVDFQNEESKRDYTYEGHRENPYIPAKQAKMMSPNSWVEQQSRSYQEKVGEKLTNAWLSQTCKRALESESIFHQADLSMRCSLAKDSRFQEVVDSWYSKNFYVTESQARYVLKF